MMCRYTHITIDEREKILVMREKMSITAIAKALGRNKSSISRELKRNSDGEEYRASEAQKHYCTRRKKCHRKKILLSDDSLRLSVIKGLEQRWSPEQISGRLKNDSTKSRISFATIYRALSQKLLPQELIKNLRKRGRKVIKASDETRGKLHNYRSIHDRPSEADNRSRMGDWECDTVRGALNKGCLATFVDRKSRLLVAVKMPNRKADTLTNVFINAFTNFQADQRLSFTVDHGNEFFGFADVENALNTCIYFADPYCPWQRGTNENTNGLLRQYFPKKFDFTTICDADVQVVVDQLNNRPRKILGFSTPLEVFHSLCCT